MSDCCRFNKQTYLHLLNEVERETTTTIQKPQRCATTVQPSHLSQELLHLILCPKQKGAKDRVCTAGNPLLYNREAILHPMYKQMVQSQEC